MSDCELIKNWNLVREKVKQASLASNKSDVTLLAVSKTKPVEMIETLLRAGQTDFGENYLQEALGKIAALNTMLEDETNDKNHVVWHYIGKIQRNKTRDIAENFDWVHTIERDVIAKRLNEQRPEHLPKLNVLIQVNIDNEESKSGCMPNEVNALVDAIKSYDKLSLRGLMIIPSKSGLGVNNSAFERTKQLFMAIADNHPELTTWDTLSMGMSADMQEAINYGSTMVRVGSAIFGARV